MRSRRREPGRRRRIHWVLEAVCVAATAVEAFRAVVGGASSWVALLLLLVLAAELLAVAAGAAAKARSRYYRGALEGEERLLSAEASLWLGIRDGE